MSIQSNMMSKKQTKNDLLNIEAKKVYLFFIDFETNALGSFRPPTQTPVQVSYTTLDEPIQTHYIRGATQISQRYNPKKLTIPFLEKHGIHFTEVIERIRSFIERTNIDKLPVKAIAHNASFDSGLLNNMLHHTRTTLPKMSWCCTLQESISFCDLPNNKYPTLTELANKLGVHVDTSALHSSDYDVKILRECYENAPHLQK